MASGEGAMHVYSLTIIGARDISKVPHSPALYVRLLLSGNKLWKTEIIRNSLPLWEHMYPLAIKSSSILSFHLKHSRGWFGAALLGSVKISVEALLAQCAADQRATLSLRDERGQEAGLLVVQLQDLETQIYQTPTPTVPDPATTAVPDALNPLRRVVDKTKIVVDFVDNTMKLYPYANIAWQVLNLAYQFAARGKINANDAFRGLVASMDNLYSFVDVVEGPENRIKSSEDILIRISIQTTECGIFLKQYAFKGYTDSGASGTLLNFSEALEKLRVDLNDGVAPHTPLVSAQVSLRDERSVGIEALRCLEPASMDATTRETCLPGTRQSTLNNLVNYLTDPSLRPGRNVIWLRGPAGSGKSIILNTIAQHFLDLRRRGAFLFWDRNDPLNSGPPQMIRTLAFQLAEFSPIFAANLATRIDLSPNIATSTSDTQFRYFIMKPLEEFARKSDLGPIVIILDAFDECGTVESRRELLGALSVGLTKLPTEFRVLISSRDEPDIRDALSRLKVDTWDVPVGDATTASDISHYLRRQIANALPRFEGYNLRPNWPGEEAIKKLVDQSDGLFTWASTAIRFIESGDPEEILGEVLDASVQDPSLSNLYRVALTHHFHSSDKSELDAVRSILGAMQVVREEVTDNQLSQLLGLKLDAVQSILSKLWPILRWDRGRPVRVFNAPLSDFFCHPDRRQDMPWPTHISYHDDLASDCFQAMERDLKFNICGIETSYYRNQDIDDIQDRIDRAITPALMYASRYWIDHLELGTTPKSGPHPLADTITSFINDGFLYWIEVFSATNQMFMIPIILKKAVSWARDHVPGLHAIISEAQEFANAFQYPMSQSIPHIYLSALPFAPSDSAFLRRICNTFRNTLSIQAASYKQFPTICRTLRGHSGPVWSVAFSTDGTRIASGSEDMTIRLWDPMSGAQMGSSLRGHSGPVYSVAFSSDGTHLISGSSDKTIRIWDAASCTPIRKPLQGHSSWVQSVACSPDNSRIISGSSDKTIRIWDAASGAPIGEPLRGHSDVVHSVAFSPDGTFIVSGSYDMTVRIWDVMSGTPIGEPLSGHSDWVLSVAISPDGAHVISSSFDKTARIWDVMPGVPIGEPIQGSPSPLRSVAISPDGVRFVSGSYDNTIQIWDAMSGAPIGWPLRGHTASVRSVAYSPDGTRIISSADDNTIQVWDVMSGTATSMALHRHSSAVQSVAFSPTGTHIASGSYDKTIQIWDAMSGAPIGKSLRGHADKISSIAFSPDSAKIVSGSHDKTVRIWDASSGAPIGKPLRGHSHVVQSVAFSPDGKRIVSGSNDKTIRIWDTASGTPISEPLRGHTHWVLSVSFSPDGMRIISGSCDKTIRIWDAVSCAPIAGPLQGHSRWVRSVAFSPDGTRIVAGSDDRTLRVWDAASGAPIGHPLQGHSHCVRSVAFSHDGTRIASGSDDKTVRIWDAASGTPIGEPLHGHIGVVESVAFSPTGDRVVSASQDTTIRVWDVSLTAPTSKSLQGQSATASPSGNHFVSTSDNQTIQLPAFAAEANGTSPTRRSSFIVSETSGPRGADVPNGVPMFSDGSVLHDDGWVTANGLLLFWIPPEHRLGLFRPGTVAIIGARSTQLNSSRFVHGPQWTLCQIVD